MRITMQHLQKNKSKHASSARKVLLVDEKKSPFIVTESFRNLTTNIGFAIPKKEEGKAKIFCITSSVAGEGKTTIAANLALTYARSGAKTILVDCDMRKPRIRQYFKVNTEGIVSYLSGQSAIGDIISKDVEPNLDVIICRRTAPNPLVLLNNDSFGELLSKLENEYEYVVIDTPPVDIVSDVTIIGQKTDGVIVVTRQMYSNHKLLQETLNKLSFANCRMLGFVLNAYTVSHGKYYGGKYGYKYKYSKYGYRGYHRYGYSYRDKHADESAENQEKAD